MMSKAAKLAFMERKPVKERIVTASFYSKFIKLTVIHVYVTTTNAKDEVKDIFYEQLQTIVENVHAHDMIIVIGDMNAKVGVGNERIMGKHGTGISKNNGERLVGFCRKNDLVITGTIFPHKNIHKNTRTSPDKRITSQINHTLFKCKYHSSTKDTLVKRGTDVASGHQLVRSQVKVKLRKHLYKTKTNPRIKYDTCKLQNHTIKSKFIMELKNKFALLEAILEDIDIEVKWKNFDKAFNQTAREILGVKIKKQKPWIGPDSWEKVEERKHLKIKIENANPSELNSRCKRNTKPKTEM
uniref:Endonuclease/exonuclease/phosphatase domain-containing protein n=1 Tax=Octopus bimaculoides TaxID=37653 RepID=A0A0L8GU75_OCTBM